MLRRPPRHAFTLAELMISMAASMLIVTALLAGSMSLQRSLHGSEIFGSSQADQRRLMDYIARDLRRSTAIAARDTGTTTGLTAGGALDLSDRMALVLTLPGYYQSEAAASADFDRPLPVVASEAGVGYGTTDGFAPGVEVSYRKVFVPDEGCVCFVRLEAGAQHVIVRQAEGLFLRVTISGDGLSGIMEAWFRLASSSVRPVVSTHDQVMLRNRRTDAAE